MSQESSACTPKQFVYKMMICVSTTVMNIDIILVHKYHAYYRLYTITYQNTTYIYIYVSYIYTYIYIYHTYIYIYIYCISITYFMMLRWHDHPLRFLGPLLGAACAAGLQWPLQPNKVPPRQREEYRYDTQLYTIIHNYFLIYMYKRLRM